MVNQIYRVLPKGNLEGFFKALKGLGVVYAPVKTGAKTHAFKRVEELAEADLSYVRTMLPPKKLFIAPKENLYELDLEREEFKEAPAGEARVLLGVHACDIHALNLLEKVYVEAFTDRLYKARRDNTFLVGWSCTPDEHCFCRSTGTSYATEGFDLFLHDLGDRFFIRVGSLRGYSFLEAHGGLTSEALEEDVGAFKELEARRAQEFSLEVDFQGLQDMLDLSYDSPLWEEYAEKCLGCGSCNLVCPCCRCYDVQDHLNVDGVSGVRERKWYSCMLRDHGLVAGGHNFRATQAERLRNRVNCKGSLKEGMVNCVGCGRCTVFCPANIDIVEILRRVRG